MPTCTTEGAENRLIQPSSTPTKSPSMLCGGLGITLPIDHHWCMSTPPRGLRTGSPNLFLPPQLATAGLVTGMPSLCSHHEHQHRLHGRQRVVTSAFNHPHHTYCPSAQGPTQLPTLRKLPRGPRISPPEPTNTNVSVHCPGGQGQACSAHHYHSTGD